MGSREKKSSKRKSRLSGEMSKTKKQVTMDNFVMHSQQTSQHDRDDIDDDDQWEETNSTSGGESSVDEGEGVDSSRNSKIRTSKNKCHTKTMDNDIISRILDNQKEIQRNLSALVTEMKKQQQNVDRQLDVIATLQQDMTGVKTRIQKIEDELTDLSKSDLSKSDYPVQVEENLERLEMKMNNMERKQREKNVRLIGVTETFREDCLGLVYKILRDEMDIHGDIEVAHRTGRRSTPQNQQSRPRHIIFRVSHIQCKNDILSAQRYALRDKPYFFTDDLTKMDLDRKRELKPEIDRARRNGQRWRFRDGQLFVEGRSVRQQNSNEENRQSRQNRQSFFPSQPASKSPLPPSQSSFYRSSPPSFHPPSQPNFRPPPSNFRPPPPPPPPQPQPAFRPPPPPLYSHTAFHPPLPPPPNFQQQQYLYHYPPNMPQNPGFYPGTNQHPPMSTTTMVDTAQDTAQGPTVSSSSLPEQQGPRTPLPPKHQSPSRRHRSTSAGLHHHSSTSRSRSRTRHTGTCAQPPVQNITQVAAKEIGDHEDPIQKHSEDSHSTDPPTPQNPHNT